MSETADAPLPLVYPEQKNPPPRPTYRDEAVRLAGVNSIIDEVVDWFAPHWVGHRDEVVADLLLVAGEHDGYRACRVLERLRGWSPDENLVDILAGLASAVLGAERAAVRAWAEANGIRPCLSVGDLVETPHGRGPIVSIREEEASYIVETDDYRRHHPDGRGGYIVAYDRCEPVAATAEAA
jgi:hypothetical protein